MAEVPGKWDCQIGSRTYMYDTKYLGSQQFTRSSIQLLKPQQSSGSINEAALNPADGIRAAVESWHHGAGQTYADRPDSDPYRFRSSKGIDVWTKGKLSLLPDVQVTADPAAGNVGWAMSAGARLYVSVNAATAPLSFTANILTATPTWTAVTGGPVSTDGYAPYRGATDGYRVWMAFGTSGIYETNTSSTALASRTTGNIRGPIGYVKGRLMASDNESIYNIIDFSGAVARPTALFTHPNSTFRWVGFAEGLHNIYAAGWAGDKSQIYRTSVKPDGTALDTPVLAGVLPDGEVVYSIDSYLGLVLIGTDKGWWVASQDSNGDLTVNKVQDLVRPVRCFEGQGDFIWYGWEVYDGSSDVIGRADLRSDTKGASVITPAYASDLVYPQSNYILSICTFQGVRCVVTGGHSVYTEKVGTDPTSTGYFSITSGGGTASNSTSTPGATRVASGTLESGLITYGMPDNKVAAGITVVHEPLNGTVVTAIAVDDGSFTNINTSSTATTTSAYSAVTGAAGSAFELRETLTRSGIDTTLGPVVKRVTLESNMAPGRGEYINVALLMYESVKAGGDDGADASFAPAAAYAELLALETSGATTTLTDALGAVTVTLEDHDFLIDGFTQKRDGFVGTFLARFRKPRAH